MKKIIIAVDGSSSTGKSTLAKALAKELNYVFPDAELKIFVTSDPEVRVERRFKELYAKNTSINIEDVKNNLEMRDYIDSNREVSPLRKADDAIVLDNSDLTKEEQLAAALKLVKEKIK